jgi:ribosomal protein S18 acetylase RimI-like enzyme
MIEEWRPDRVDGSRLDTEIGMLADVLHAAVHDGASVSFVLPFELAEARAYWRDEVLPEVRRRMRRVLIARIGEEMIGTVQLKLDVPPNGRHRAEVIKLLVHPKARRQGVGRKLMLALEEVARAEGRTLLTLDTRTGDAAEPLYRSIGFVQAGAIPRYARGPLGAELESTTIMYKELGSEVSG